MEHESCEDRRAEWLRANGYRPRVKSISVISSSGMVTLLDHGFIEVRGDSSHDVLDDDPYCTQLWMRTEMAQSP